LVTPSAFTVAFVCHVVKSLELNKWKYAPGSAVKVNKTFVPDGLDSMDVNTGGKGVSPVVATETHWAEGAGPPDKPPE
jgi:hypothetical protein